MTHSLKNVLPELTVSVQINTRDCGGASLNVHVKAEEKSKLKKVSDFGISGVIWMTNLLIYWGVS